MSLESPIYKKVMSQYQVNDTPVGIRSIKNGQGSSLALDIDDISQVDSLASLGQPSMGSGAFPDNTPSPEMYPTNSMMNTLWDVETKGGKLSDRSGSQYRGIGQLGDDIRKPLLKKYGYTEDQYDNDVNIQKKLSTEHIENLRGRIGNDATNLDLWGSHNMGVSGWKQIKSGKVSPTVLRNLRNQKGMNANSTPQDYIDYYAKIFK